MEKTFYEDHKYSMQDVSHIYVGCKYTFGELLEEEEISFKFRLIMERYILQEADPGDTLESHLYYLAPGSFPVKLYKQMKARIKVNLIEEKKAPFGFGAGRRGKNNPGSGGESRKEYVTRMLTIEELVSVSPTEKERQGYVIQELCVSKLALATL